MSKPLWRRAVDDLDARATPVVNSLVGSDVFIQALALVVRAKLTIASQSEELSRSLVHALNLPAGSDVNRLLTQTASVERAVRELTKALEDTR